MQIVDTTMRAQDPPNNVGSKDVIEILRQTIYKKARKQKYAMSALL
jgi:hypothetical protein